MFFVVETEVLLGATRKSLTNDILFHPAVLGRQTDRQAALLQHLLK